MRDIPDQKERRRKRMYEPNVTDSGSLHSPNNMDLVGASSFCLFGAYSLCMMSMIC